jgi:hypothetical protein
LGPEDPGDPGEHTNTSHAGTASIKATLSVILEGKRKAWCPVLWRKTGSSNLPDDRRGRGRRNVMMSRRKACDEKEGPGVGVEIREVNGRSYRSCQMMDEQGAGIGMANIIHEPTFQNSIYRAFGHGRYIHVVWCSEKKEQNLYAKFACV